jgi:uncharacterized protein (DUF2267 family)
MEPKSTLTGREELVEMLRASDALPPGVDPNKAVTAVMCTLTAHLTQGEACDVLEQMPGDIQSLFQLCVTHRGEPAQKFHASDFYRRVAKHLNISKEQAEKLSQAVLKVVRHWLSDKEIADVASQLPRDLNRIWRAA